MQEEEEEEDGGRGGILCCVVPPDLSIEEACGEGGEGGTMLLLLRSLRFFGWGFDAAERHVVALRGEEGEARHHCCRASKYFFFPSFAYIRSYGASHHVLSRSSSFSSSPLSIDDMEGELLSWGGFFRPVCFFAPGAIFCPPFHVCFCSFFAPGCTVILISKKRRN